MNKCRLCGGELKKYRENKIRYQECTVCHLNELQPDQLHDYSYDLGTHRGVNLSIEMQPSD